MITSLGLLAIHSRLRMMQTRLGFILKQYQILLKLWSPILIMKVIVEEHNKNIENNNALLTWTIKIICLSRFLHFVLVLIKP